MSAGCSSCGSLGSVGRRSAVAAVGTFAVSTAFGIVTGVQLLELAKPIAPLLRRLLVETPGILHHSLMVGNLAEPAAEAIGADRSDARRGVLPRRGKLSNPLALIENQQAAEHPRPPRAGASARRSSSSTSPWHASAYAARLPGRCAYIPPAHTARAVMSYFLARARERAAEAVRRHRDAEGAKPRRPSTSGSPPCRPEAADSRAA